jgi:hypothetical protein
LIAAQGTEAAGFELQHVHEGDEVNAGMIEAVVALVVRGLAEATEVLAHRRIAGVVLAGHGVHLARIDPREELLGVVEFRRPGQVSDVARMNEERRSLRHRVHEIDGARERRVDIRIGILVEADVRIAQLHEQGTAEPGRALGVRGRGGEIERGEYAAREYEERACPAVGETAERLAAGGGIERVIRHNSLLGL